MQTTVLVTGGFGFIGAHLIGELLRNGRRVVVIDREPEGNAADDVLDPDQRGDVQHIASAVPDAQTLTRLLRDHAVATVVHLASPLATVTEGRPESVVHEMIAPHLAVLDASRDAGVRRVVWASSVGVFGRAKDYALGPLPNDAHHRPLTLYGATKSFLERLSCQYTDRYGLDTLGLRFPLVYGPGRRRGGGQFTTNLIEGAALGQACVVEASDERYDWMYVADAARSLLLAADAAPSATRAITVCGQVATTRQVAEMLSAWFPEARITTRQGHNDLIAECDPTAARDAIGYEPSVALHEGVLATANSARQRAGLPPVT